MAKTKETGKKVDLPKDVNFLALIDEAITGALADTKNNGLGSTQEKSLAKITNHPQIKNLLAKALENAAKDGLYESEVTEILGDANDLIFKASNETNFNAMIKNPAAQKFHLSLDTVVAIKGMTPDEKESLWKELETMEPTAGEKFLAGLKDIAKDFLPIFKVIAVKALEIGASMLGKLVNDKVDGPMGDVLEAGVKSLAVKAEDLVSRVSVDDDGSVDLSGAQGSHDNAVPQHG